MTGKQNGFHNSLSRYLNSPDENHDLVSKITKGYRDLFPPGFSRSKLTTRITLKTTPLNLEEYKNTPFYKTVKKLRKFVRKELTPFISYFFIHGSLATLDYVPGFSDLDTYIFVKKDVCANPKKLKQFKTRLALAQKLLKEIAPNSHHGFLCCNEANLDYYCNAYMPVPVFRNAKTIYGPNQITFYLRDSRTEHRQAFERFAGILLNPKRFGSNSVNLFDLKYFVAVLLLMPTLYLQARGSNLYKRYSFRLYTHPLLDKATLVRKYFGQKSLGELIQLLGPNYLKQTKNMINEMKLAIKKQGSQNKTYVNKPAPISIKYYEKAREEVISNFKTNSDVAAIYEYGSVQSPGISDLDLIVVTHSDLKSSQPEDYRVTSEKFRYASRVATGTLMVVNKKDFANISFFDEINLKRLYGENILQNRISAADLKHREIASVVDWLPERLTRLIRMLKQPQFDVQNSLLYLRSFGYVLERVSKLTGDPYFAGTTREVLETRSLWLKCKATDLRYLVTRLIYAGYEAMDIFTDKFFDRPCNTKGELFLFPWQRILFTSDTKKIDPDMAISFSTPEKSTVPVSSKLLPHFLHYSRQPGALARNMRRQFKLIRQPTPHLINNRSYTDFLSRKISLATKYAEFLKRNKFKSGLYRFGFYFKA